MFAGLLMGAASVFAGTSSPDEHWANAPHTRTTLVHEAGADADDPLARHNVKLVEPPEGTGRVHEPRRRRGLFRRRRT